MLYIEEKHNGVISEQEWHTGEPMPYIAASSRVVTFQADGEELQVIIEAIRKASQK